MKKILFPIFLFLAACDSIDDPEVYDISRALPAPSEITVTASTPTSLSLSWSEVAEAVQYGYSLCDALGKEVTGGTTNETAATFSGLSIFSDYTFKVSAFPTLGNGGTSDVAEWKVKTPFYDRIDNAEGVYTSYLLNSQGKSYTATLNEDRSAADYKEGWFGVFTLTRFYEYTSGTLVFTVNADGSISIKNATQHKTENDVNWAVVTTGIKMPASRKQVYIDESTSSFDITTNTLTLTARFSDTSVPKSELFRW